MKQLQVSAVIPAYNRAHLIGRALRSALNDLGPADEVLVIDDGSTDRTESVVREFGDPRVRYIRQSHAGAGAARNLGAREARWDLLAFLDSDDEWLPGKAALQRAFMAARPDVLFCFSDFVGENGEWRRRRCMRFWHTDPRSWTEIMGAPEKYSSIAALPPGIPDFDVFVGNIYRGEMHTNYIPSCTLMIRRKEAGDAIHFAENVSTYEDWECWGRIAGRGLGAYLDYEGAVNHVHTGPRLTDAGRAACAEARLVVLRNVWGSDPEFLGKYGEEYRALAREEEFHKVRGLLIMGQTKAARAEVRRLSGVPFTYRALAWIHPGLTTFFIRLRSGTKIRIKEIAQALARSAEEWVS